MANNTLAAIRARLAASEQNNKSFDNATFPFWNAKTDSTSVIRFLPDGNSKNDFFWVEKQQIKLPFAGIRGGDAKPVYVNVPCVEQWGREEYPQGCPILSEVRAWYKDPSLVDQANRYWKKPSYIMQGFVRENSVPDDNTPENPIRRFSLNKQLFNLVKAGLMDADMENIPCDYEKGTDFRIVKSTKGQYADYGTSSYARRESALTKAELAAIEQYGLNDLSQFLGKRPTAEDLRVIREMFEASVNGEQYDVERWGKYYRPAGLKAADDATDSEAQTATTSPAVARPQVDEPVAAVVKEATVAVPRPAASNSGKSAADILAMIQNRGAATK